MNQESSVNGVRRRMDGMVTLICNLTQQIIALNQES